MFRQPMDAEEPFNALGLYRYLLRCQHGKWLIDRVKHEQDGQWQNHIL
mgnify:CR=1 FL=1